MSKQSLKESFQRFNSLAESQRYERYQKDVSYLIPLLDIPFCFNQVDAEIKQLKKLMSLMDSTYAIHGTTLNTLPPSSGIH